MATQQGSNFKLYVKEQTDAETLATGNFVQLPVKSFDLSAAQPLNRDDLLSANVGRDGTDPYLETLSMTGSAMVPIDTVCIGYWLKMLLGAATVTGTTDKVHVWKSGAASLPDFSMEKAFPQVAQFFMALGIKANTLSFDLAPTGPANATIGLMGLNETPASVSGAGTATLPVFQRFQRPTATIKKDGVALAKVVGGTLNYSNGMEAVQTIRADNRMDSIDLGTATAGADMRLRYTDTSQSLITQAIAGTPIALEYGFTISATKAILFEFPRFFLNRPGIAVSGPAGIELPVQGQAAFDPTVGAMMRVTLRNQNAAY
jgi:hypothetical protein